MKPAQRFVVTFAIVVTFALRANAALDTARIDSVTGIKGVWKVPVLASDPGSGGSIREELLIRWVSLAAGNRGIVGPIWVLQRMVERRVSGNYRLDEGAIMPSAAARGERSPRAQSWLGPHSW